MIKSNYHIMQNGQLFSHLLYFLFGRAINHIEDDSSIENDQAEKHRAWDFFCDACVSHGILIGNTVLLFITLLS